MRKRRPFLRRSWRVAPLMGTCTMISVAYGQTVNAPSGLPPAPIATYQELGMGGWTAPTSGGTQQINGSGSVVSTTPAGSSGATSATDTMYSQAWGYAAAQNASSLGVNPDALAATCVMESGCQNVYTASGGNTITGAFQMSNGTYSQELQKALASDPTLAASITDTGISGQQDPATQAIAAAQYLKDAASTLQNNGISNPTALDARAYYNFGPSAGTQIATANDTAPMSNYISSNAMSGNGISPGETVGQWRTAIAAKMGSAASSPILGA